MTRAKAIPETVTVHVPFRLVKRGGRKEVLLPPGKAAQRSCQTNSNWSLQGQYDCPLCRAELTPLRESGGAVELEIFA